LENDIHDEIVNTLLQVCEEKAPLFQRYFRLKAKAGMERLRRVDLYAPLERSEKRFGWEEAKGLIFEAFQSFRSHVAKLA
jgi:oligoendopeptidase F